VADLRADPWLFYMLITTTRTEETVEIQISPELVQMFTIWSSLLTGWIIRPISTTPQVWQKKVGHEPSIYHP